MHALAPGRLSDHWPRPVRSHRANPWSANPRAANPSAANPCSANPWVRYGRSSPVGACGREAAAALWYLFLFRIVTDCFTAFDYTGITTDGLPIGVQVKSIL